MEAAPHTGRGRPGTRCAMAFSNSSPVPPPQPLPRLADKVILFSAFPGTGRPAGSGRTDHGPFSPKIYGGTGRGGPAGPLLRQLPARPQDPARPVGAPPS